MSLTTVEDECVADSRRVTKTGKVILVGSTGAGKTSLLMKFLHGATEPNVQPTIWPSIFRFRFPADYGSLSMEVWDTSGQEKFRSLVPFYFEDIDAALIVFDVTKLATFTQAKTWASDILHHCEKRPGLLLVGNKRDLSRRREISKMEALAYAEKIEADYLECSTKNQKDVHNLFLEISRKTLKFSTVKSLVGKNKEKSKWYEECSGFSFKSLLLC